VTVIVSVSVAAQAVDAKSALAASAAAQMELQRTNIFSSRPNVAVFYAMKLKVEFIRTLTDVIVARGFRTMPLAIGRTSQAAGGRFRGRPSVIAMTLISRMGDPLSGTLSIAPVISDAVARGAVCLWMRVTALAQAAVL